jgi:hypothetical protein
MNSNTAHSTSNDTMASDASICCSRWTCPTIKGSYLVVYCRAVGGYRGPVKGDVSSVKVDVSDTDIVRCIKKIYDCMNLL